MARRQAWNPAVMDDGRYTSVFILPSPDSSLLQLLGCLACCVLPIATRTIHHELLHSSDLKQRRGPGTGLPQNASGRGLPRKTICGYVRIIIENPHTCCCVACRDAPADSYSLVSPTTTEMFKFEVPSLTVGTLDTLMVRFTAWFD